METRDYVTAAWVALRVLLSGTRITQSQHLFVWCRLFNSELIWLSSNVGTKRTFSHASGVKLRPCHIPQRRVMKYGLPCFVRNSGSLVCTAHKYLDKLVPFLTNLQSASSLRGRTHVVESSCAGTFFFVFARLLGIFQFTSRWLQPSARCTTSPYSAGTLSLSRVLLIRMERSYQRGSSSTEDLGSTSLFWIWWVHLPSLQKYNSSC